MRTRAGQEVTHPVYGSGVVIALRDRARVKVRFEGREHLPLTVAAEDLECVESPAGPPPPEAKGPTRQATSEETADLRQTVEALRLGVVPRTHARDYTVARETELGDFEALLDTGRGLRLVWGDYGTGKTHLLDLYERMALRAGFVATRVTLDPRETPPSHPQRLFREIVRNLLYPEIPGEGLDPLLLALADSPDHFRPGAARASRVLSPVLLASRHPDTEAALWTEDYIGGYPMDIEYGARELRRIGWDGPRPLSLSDFRTYGRMYVHLVGTLAAWARDAGFEGLVVLFDEVEYVEMTRGASRGLAEEVLQHYAAITLPTEKLAFDPERLYRGGHAVHRSIPLRFDDDQRLLVIMALTPLPEAREIAGKIIADHEEDLDLTPLTGRHFAELARRVAALYARAYPGYEADARTIIRIAEAAAEDAVLGDGSPRETVRRTVMQLDADRLGRRAGGG